jgi:hypothetical protein
VAVHYELLRQAALDPSPDLVAGFGVVIGRGVSAWVRASLTAPEEPHSPPADHRPRLPRDVVRADVVRVWAQMALAVHAKEVAPWTSVAPGPRR